MEIEVQWPKYLTIHLPELKECVMVRGCREDQLEELYRFYKTKTWVN